MDGDNDHNGILVGSDTTIGMISGRYYDLSSGDPPTMLELAWGLAGVIRWVGQSRKMITVAEHSIRCWELAQRMDVDRNTRQAVLLHEVDEVVFGDPTRPFKMLLRAWCGDKFAELCKTIRRRFGAHHGVDFDTAREDVVRVDNAILYFERHAAGPPVDGSWRGEETARELLEAHNRLPNNECYPRGINIGWSPFVARERLLQALLQERLLTQEEATTVRGWEGR